MVGPYVLPSDLPLLWLPMANFTSLCIHWFFFFWERDRHRADFVWWKPWITCWLLLPLWERGDAGLTALHLVLSTGHGKASGMLLPTLPPPDGQGSSPAAASCCLLPPSPQGSEKREHGSFSLSSLYQLQPFPLTLTFLQAGNLKAHPQAQDKAFRPITRQRHNSGELAETLVFSVILETGWGNSCTRTKVTAYKLLRKDGKGGREGGVTLSVKERFEDMGKRTSQLSAFGSKPEVSPSRECLWWVSWMDNLIDNEKQMKSSSDHLKTDNGSLGCSVKTVDLTS